MAEVRRGRCASHVGRGHGLRDCARDRRGAAPPRLARDIRLLEARSTVDAVVGALASRYRWQIDPSWIVWLPGLVCGLNVAARAFADEGDEVLSLSPVYAPFVMGPRQQG